MEGPTFGSHRLDWHSAHFGCPGSALFFTSGLSRYYLRVFQSNPTGGHGGEDSVDISFGVPEYLEAQVIETLRTDLESVRWPANIIPRKQSASAEVNG